mgnify:FL=1
MKKGEHKGRPAPGDRGLFDFAEIVDTYGQTVTVRSSSAADRPCVWIFVKDRCGGSLVTNAAGHVQHISPHLGVREAKLLRDALERFIASVEG